MTTTAANGTKKTRRQLEQSDQVPVTKVRKKCKTHAGSQAIHIYLKEAAAEAAAAAAAAAEGAGIEQLRHSSSSVYSSSLLP